MTFAAKLLYRVGMDDITWIDQPQLSNALAIVAFTGWNDAGSAASDAADEIREQSDAELMAIIDHDEFEDYQENRPTVSIDGGGTRRLEWPDTRLFVSTKFERDLVILIGDEPALRWKRFSRVLSNGFHSLGVTEVISLGAFLGETPHTREVPVMGGFDAPTRERYGLRTSQYEGPTGIIGVLNHLFLNGGFEGGSLWAGCPHYLASHPNPKAARALLNKVGLVTGLEFDASEFDEAVEEWTEDVAEASQHSELAEYVAELERIHDEEAQEPAVLLSEIEDFLRRQ